MKKRTIRNRKRIRLIIDDNLSKRISFLPFCLHLIPDNDDFFLLIRTRHEMVVKISDIIFACSSATTTKIKLYFVFFFAYKIFFMVTIKKIIISIHHLDTLVLRFAFFSGILHCGDFCWWVFGVVDRFLKELKKVMEAMLFLES